VRISKSIASIVTAGAILGIGAASAADLPARTYTKAPTIVAPVYNWTGFYVGVNAGGDWNQSDPTTTTVVSSAPTYINLVSIGAISAAGAQRINSSGFTGGLTAGYNWQSSNFVFGIESDFNYFGVRGSKTSGPVLYPCCAPSTFTVNSSVSSDWLITLRPRIGIASNNWLFYATGGLAVANVKSDFSFTDTFASAAESASISKTKAGWTAGVGTEYAVMNGWSVKAEYLYVDLGRDGTTSSNLHNRDAFGIFPANFFFPLNVFTHSADLRSNIVRVGLNYKFGGPDSAR
jgi:outer membrane immunogenic protein